MNPLKKTCHTGDSLPKKPIGERTFPKQPTRTQGVEIRWCTSSVRSFWGGFTCACGAFRWSIERTQPDSPENFWWKLWSIHMGSFSAKIHGSFSKKYPWGKTRRIWKVKFHSWSITFFLHPSNRREKPAAVAKNKPMTWRLDVESL